MYEVLYVLSSPIKLHSIRFKPCLLEAFKTRIKINLKQHIVWLTPQDTSVRD